MKHHTFPLIDRNGQRVIAHRTGEAGIIVHRGTCAYWVEFADRLIQIPKKRLFG